MYSYFSVFYFPALEIKNFRNFSISLVL